VEQFANKSAPDLASDSLGDIIKIIYLGFEKSQRSVTYDFLCYINILTSLLT